MPKAKPIGSKDGPDRPVVPTTGDMLGTTLPKSKRAYAWSYREGPNDEGERFVAVLEIPPVDSAKQAVQVQIVKDVKEKL